MGKKFLTYISLAYLFFAPWVYSKDMRWISVLYLGLIYLVISKEIVIWWENISLGMMTSLFLIMANGVLSLVVGEMIVTVGLVLRSPTVGRIPIEEFIFFGESVIPLASNPVFWGIMASIAAVAILYKIRT